MVNPALESEHFGRFRPVFAPMLHLQRFTISHEYPVYFGSSVFAPENPALVDVITRREPMRRHRVAFVVESRVAELWPGLVTGIETYVARYEQRLELAGPP